jgi:hypothetical protein
MRASSRSARTYRGTADDGTGPAGSSTTNDASSAQAWFCQFASVPYGQRSSRKPSSTGSSG